MTWFQAFRNSYGFTSYEDNRTAVTFDKPLAIVTYLCVLVSIATLITTLGIRGSQKWSSVLRASYAVAIGSFMLACLFASEWQTGTVRTREPYIYKNNLLFDGYMGIKVALNSVNVTMDGFYESGPGRGYVYYSEMISLPDFPHESRSYSYFLRRGLPEPILKVMAFLTEDDGDLRWGRSFNMSGYFTMVLLWTSFAFWIVSHVLLFSVVVYGAYLFTLTGVTMILSCVAYHVCQCQVPLVIRFTGGDLRMAYGWCFWLTLVAGILTFLLGVVLVLLDRLAHEWVSEIFHLEKLIDETHGEHEQGIKLSGRTNDTAGTKNHYTSIFMERCRLPRSLKNRRYFPKKVDPAAETSEKIVRFNPASSHEDKMISSQVCEKGNPSRQELNVCEMMSMAGSYSNIALTIFEDDKENDDVDTTSTSSSDTSNKGDVANMEDAACIINTGYSDTETSKDLACSPESGFHTKEGSLINMPKILVSDNISVKAPCEIFVISEPSSNRLY